MVFTPLFTLVCASSTLDLRWVLDYETLLLLGH